MQRCIDFFTTSETSEYPFIFCYRSKGKDIERRISRRSCELYMARYSVSCLALFVESSFSFLFMCASMSERV